MALVCGEGLSLPPETGVRREERQRVQLAGIDPIWTRGIRGMLKGGGGQDYGGVVSGPMVVTPPSLVSLRSPSMPDHECQRPAHRVAAELPYFPGV